MAAADVHAATKRASQRVEIWRKLQRYGTVPLGNSGYLLPNNSSNEERFQWLATAIRKYGGDASVVHVDCIDNLSKPQLIGRFAEARAREYQELIRELHVFSRRVWKEKGRAASAGCATGFRRSWRSISSTARYKSAFRIARAGDQVERGQVREGGHQDRSEKNTGAGCG